MFEKLRIQNFQSHKDTLLEFVPGINVIVGTSDSGKSAVFRALKWLMYNRPTGDSFCSYWSDKETRVELTLDDHMIVRAREKTKQIYELDGLAFTAFKTDVPEEIRVALNMSDVNLQQQFDRPFLLDVSSGEVAQYFNKIAHLENIDRSLKILHQKERVVKQDLGRYTDDKVTVEIKLEKYSMLDEVDQKLSVLENADKFISDIENEVEELNSLISQSRQLQEVLLASPVVTSTVEWVDEILELQKEYDVYSSLVEQYENVLYEMEEFAGLEECTVLLEEIIGSSHGIKELETLIKQIVLDIHTINTLKDTVQGTTSLIGELDSQLKKEMPAICPLCGNNTI